MARVLGPAEITYDAGSSLLQITLSVEAATLEEALGHGLREVASAAGLADPVRLLAQATADFVVDVEHPRPLNLDLVGISEIAGVLGVSRQRASQLADDPDFPAPVVRTGAGRLYTRASVQAFCVRWVATRNPRGGRRRRQPTAAAS